MVLLPVAFEGYEDWLRHRADNEVNGAPVFVVRSGSLVQTRSKNIRVRWLKKKIFFHNVFKYLSWNLKLENQKKILFCALPVSVAGASFFVIIQNALALSQTKQAGRHKNSTKRSLNIVLH